jgi:hypothetical protein
MRCWKELAVLFPSYNPTCEFFEIRLSFITFNRAIYVCGLRVLVGNEGSSIAEVSRVGFTRPETEIGLYVAPHEHLRSIVVASSLVSIVGLGICIRDASGETLLRTAGEMIDLPDGVGLATLEASPGSQLSGLVVGLDVSSPSYYSEWLLTILYVGLQIRFYSNLRA